ncbi:MAG: hypothetical protein AB7U63_09275 [Porticoccaceae bacterium]
MKSKRLGLFVALGCFAVVAPPLAATDNAAHNHGRSDGQLALDNGSKWAADSPLRHGMARLNGAVAEAVTAIHRGEMGDAGYDLLADAAAAEIAFIIDNCALEPAADAQLHHIIAEIMAGVAMAKGNASGHSRKDGVIKMRNAVNDYGRYFDDPQFDFSALQKSGSGN